MLHIFQLKMSACTGCQSCSSPFCGLKLHRANTRRIVTASPTFMNRPSSGPLKLDGVAIDCLLGRASLASRMISQDQLAMGR